MSLGSGGDRCLVNISRTTDNCYSPSILPDSPSNSAQFDISIGPVEGQMEDMKDMSLGSGGDWFLVNISRTMKNSHSPLVLPKSPSNSTQFNIPIISVKGQVVEMVERSLVVGTIRFG